MILNRSHVAWFWFTLLASALLAALYALVFHPGILPFHVPLPAWLTQPTRLHRSVGNSPLGLIYGSVAYAIFIFAVLFNTRKKFPNLRVGRAQTWLRAHIWLTILTLPLVFMHAAFHFGGGMTSTLMWLYLLVMASGFYGLALQQFMPRLLKARITLETIFEQIPFLTQQLLTKALRMRDELRPAHATADAVPVGTAPSLPARTADSYDEISKAAVLEALERDVLPYLASTSTKRFRFNEPGYSSEFFRVLRTRCGPPEQENIDLLATWCEERRQMDAQVSYHHHLHGWLLVHVPSSFLLLLLTGWHAVVLLFLY